METYKKFCQLKFKTENSLTILIPSNAVSGDYLATKLPYKNDDFEYLSVVATFHKFCEI